MKTKKIGRFILAGLIALALANTAQSQISYDGTALNYSQNFDSLANSSSWANDSTLFGWYMQATTTTFGSSGVPTSLTVAQHGGGSTANGYNIGTNGVNSSTDRALGWVVASGTGTAFTGLQLQNTSGSSFAGTVTISYTIEQYSDKNAVSETITSGYKLLASVGNQVASSGFTTLDSIVNPNLSNANTPVGIDGNASGNFTTVTDVIDLSATPWVNNQFLWFRIADPREASGNNELLAIDDVGVSIAPAPEPATWSLATFGGLLSLCVLRRKKYFHG